jgi:hypothetical protein
VSSYADCRLLWNNSRRRKLANHTYLLHSEAMDDYSIRLHRTNVVHYAKDGTVTLNSGGWRTVTTKDRINRFSPLRVWSDKGVWWVISSPVNGTVVRYEDGVSYNPNRTPAWLGQGGAS